MRNELNTLSAYIYITTCNERLNFIYEFEYGWHIHILIIMVLKRGLKDKEKRKYHTAILTHWDTTHNKCK